MAERRPVAPLFIVGAPRSGTSLLYKALCLHPQAAWVSNWSRRAPRLPEAAVLNRLAPAMPDRRRRVWFGADLGNAYVYGRRRTSAERFFPMPVEGEPVFRACGIGEPDTDGRVRAEPGAGARLAATVARLCRASGGDCFVNKRIANNQRMALLAEALPGARFVVMVRDGRAVAASLARVDWWPTTVLWWAGRTPRQLEAEGADPMEVCARAWVEEQRSIERGRAALGEDQQLCVRYEDLVAEPAATLQRVTAFAGLRPDGRFRAETARLRYPDRTETWRTTLEPAALKTVEEACGDELRRYGYGD